MFSISKASAYSLRATAALAGMYTSKQSITISELAELEEVPVSFLRKLLKPLKKAHIIRTTRGFSGGISLVRSPDDITVLEIIEAIEGKIYIHECINEPSVCEFSDICSLRDCWIEITGVLRSHFSNRTLASLSPPDPPAS